MLSLTGLISFRPSENPLPPPYRNNGFTLAETLITLVIIGVIAAITVPTLIIKHQKEETVTRLKKAYSAINQAIQMSLIENSNTKTWTLESSTIDSLEEFQKNYLKSLQIIKQIKGPLENYNSVNLNNDSNGIGTSNAYIHNFLNDGTLIHTVTGMFMSKDNYAVVFIIDTNGLKKPNKVGRDMFYYAFHPGDSVITPYGYQTSLKSTHPRNFLLTDEDIGNCNKSVSGNRCASVIIIDGWQIKDDYPW